MDFNWHTEEDEWLDEQVAPTTTNRSGRRAWWQIILPVALAALVAGSIYWSLKRQVDEAETALENDVLATHQLVRKAADAADESLFTAFLSGRDAEWSETQKQIVGQGWFNDLQPLDLYPANGLSSVQSSKVILSSDLSSAEVVEVRPFAFSAGSGLSETVFLSQTAVYRRGGDRWLFSPPNEAYWGEDEETQSEFLTVRYPARDAALVLRLTADLDTQLAELCSVVNGIDCPDGLSLDLSLLTEPRAVLKLHDYQATLTGTINLDLPTPTLLGLPGDNAGYQALLRGYGQQVVSAVIGRLTGWECCRHGLFYRALLDYHLNRLGLRPWPMQPDDYETLLGGVTDLYDQTPAWRENEVTFAGTEQWRWAYAVVGFVATLHGEAPAADMQRALGSSRDFSLWLDQFIPATWTDEWTLRQEWIRFLRDHSLSGQLAIGPDFPEDNVLVLCRPLTGETTTLYEFSPVRGAWQPELVIDGFAIMVPTRGLSGVILETYIQESEDVYLRRTYYEDEGGLKLIYDAPITDDTGFFFTGWTDSSGRRLLMLDGSMDRMAVLDVEECLAGGCQPKEVPGIPIWSPNGEQMLVYPTNAGPQDGLLRTDKEGNVLAEIGQAHDAFWLDENSYGYLEESVVMQVVTASVVDDQAEVLVTADNLRAAIPEEERPDLLFINQAVGGPAGSHVVLLSAFESGPGELKHFFAFDAATGTTTYLLSQGFNESIYPEISPSGQWVAFRRYGLSGGQNESATITLFDLVSGEQFSFHSTGFDLSRFDWSGDGRWVVQAENSYLDLMMPTYEVAEGMPYHLLVPVGQRMCDFAAWASG